MNFFIMIGKSCIRLTRWVIVTFCFFLCAGPIFSYPPTTEQSAADKQKKAFAATQLALGDLYYQGRGVARDYRQAGDYYARAIEQDVDREIKSEALLNFGLINFEGGYGVVANHMRAGTYFNHLITLYPKIQGLTSRQLHRLAQAHLHMGFLYQNGWDVAHKNWNLAQQHFELAAALTNNLEIKSEALLNLGLIAFEGGYGMAKNHMQACMYFNQLMILSPQFQGPTKVQLYQLACYLHWGLLYQNGWGGVQKNWKLARRYFASAAALATNCELKCEALLLAGNLCVAGDETLPRNLSAAFSFYNFILTLVACGMPVSSGYHVACAKGFYTIGILCETANASLDLACKCFLKAYVLTGRLLDIESKEFACVLALALKRRGNPVQANGNGQ